MSLLDRARRISADRQPGPQCTVARFPDEVRADIEDAIEEVDGRDLTYAGLAQAVWEDYGLKVGYQSLSRHRRRGQAGGCACGTS